MNSSLFSSVLVLRQEGFANFGQQIGKSEFLTFQSLCRHQQQGDGGGVVPTRCRLLQDQPQELCLLHPLRRWSKENKVNFKNFSVKIFVS